MALGSWDPEAQSASENLTLTAELLDELMGYSDEESLASLQDRLASDRAQVLAGLMSVAASDWQAAAETLDSQAIRQLIRFFAVAENLPGWEAGQHSPVIPLAKALRARGDKLEREFLLWLREVNDNRFLPYGPL